MECNCVFARLVQGVRKNLFWFLAPLALLILCLLVLYLVYGPKLFVAFIYAGV